MTTTADVGGSVDVPAGGDLGAAVLHVVADVAVYVSLGGTMPAWPVVLTLDGPGMDEPRVVALDMMQFLGYVHLALHTSVRDDDPETGDENGNQTEDD